MLSQQSTASSGPPCPPSAPPSATSPPLLPTLFAARPDLLDGLFNRGNQRRATSSRPSPAHRRVRHALLVNPGRPPRRVLARIAHKHASLGITDDQYPIVHEHLFAAIAEVLGDAVTPEVAAAWDEVYWLMADALIAIEERLYAAAGVADGDVWRAWRSPSGSQESADAVVLRARARPTAARCRRSGPASTSRVQVRLPDGARQIRQYSLSGAPAPTSGDHRQAGPRRRRAPRRRGVQPPARTTSGGRRAERLGPFGDLVLDRTATPRCCWPPPASASPRCSRCWTTWPTTGAPARCCVRARRPLRPPTTRCAPTRGLTQQAARRRRRLLVRGRRSAGTPRRPDGPDRASAIAPGTDAYLCGPLPFMRAVRAQLIARGVRRRHPLRGVRPRPVARAARTGPRLSPVHLQRIAERGTCGKPPVLPHNRGP